MLTVLFLLLGMAIAITQVKVFFLQHHLQRYRTIDIGKCDV
jgi:hypothetical protein